MRHLVHQFIRSADSTAFAGFPVVVKAQGNPIALFGDVAGLASLSNVGQTLTTTSGTVDVWAPDASAYTLELRTPEGFLLDTVVVYGESVAEPPSVGGGASDTQPFVKHLVPTVVDFDGDMTLTVQQVLSGSMEFLGDGGTRTLPSAADLGAALGAAKGTVFDFIIYALVPIPGQYNVNPGVGMTKVGGVITNTDFTNITADEETGVMTLRLFFTSATTCILCRYN